MPKEGCFKISLFLMFILLDWSSWRGPRFARPPGVFRPPGRISSTKELKETVFSCWRSELSWVFLVWFGEFGISNCSGDLSMWLFLGLRWRYGLATSLTGRLTGRTGYGFLLLIKFGEYAIFGFLSFTNTSFSTFLTSYFLLSSSCLSSLGLNVK